MTSAAIYARSSKDRSDVSISTQARELCDLASSKGLRVVQTFEDSVESGATDIRPAFSELVAAIKNPRRGWGTLLVYDTSRIARRRYIAQAFKHLAKKAGVTILYAKLPSDLDPVAEVVLESVFEAMDEAHSLMSRDKALAGMRENIHRGWRAGGRAPLGYRLERVPTGAIRDGKAVMKSRLTPSEDAPKLVEYLRRRAAGEPRLSVLRAIGVEWKPNSMVDVERRALVYAGHLVWNQHANGRLLPRERWQINPGAHPALISEAEAEAVMRQLSTGLGRKVADGRRAASASMLSALLWAPDGRRWRAGGEYYRLDGRPSRKVRKGALEDAVTQAVMIDVAKPDFLAGLIDASREKAADAGPRETLVKEIGRVTRERDRAARLALETEQADVYTALVAERSRQIAGLQRELSALSEDDAITKRLRSLTPGALRDLLMGAEPGAIVLALVERVVIGPDLQGTIEYRQVGAVSVASPRVCHRYGPALVLPFRAA